MSTSTGAVWLIMKSRPCAHACVGAVGTIGAMGSISYLGLIGTSGIARTSGSIIVRGVRCVFGI